MFVSWIGWSLLIVFVSQERNLIITIASAHIALDWRCLIVTRHFYWERRSKTTVSVLRAKKKLYALRKLVSWLMFQLCPRTACPRGTPSEPLMFVWPGRKIVPLISSARTWLNLWLTAYTNVQFCTHARTHRSTGALICTDIWYHYKDNCGRAKLLANSQPYVPL